MAANKNSLGSFCWFELATTDQEAAKKFYSSVFGWTPNDAPMGPSEMYTMFQIGGQDAAAGYTMRPEQRAMGVPPNWMPYILVKSADESAAKAKQLGGKVHVEPFEVMDAGRMAVVEDPTGAHFCVWQARKSQGVGVTSGHGAAVWLDLNTTDVPRASKFYSDLFGWKMVNGKEMKPAKPGEYFHIVNGTQFIGGIPPTGPHMANMPSNWLTYFDVADAGATISKVQSLGGRVMMPAMTMGNVRTYAVLADPQGAVFAVVQELGGKEDGEPKAATKAASAASKATAKPGKATPKPKAKAGAKPKAKAKKAAPARKAKAKARTASPKPRPKAGKASPKPKAKAGRKKTAKRRKR